MILSKSATEAAFCISKCICLYFCVGFSDMKPWNSDIAPAPLIVTVALLFTSLMFKISFTSSSHRASAVKDPGTCFRVLKRTLKIPPSLAIARRNTVFISFQRKLLHREVIQNHHTSPVLDKDCHHQHC